MVHTFNPSTSVVSHSALTLGCGNGHLDRQNLEMLDCVHPVRLLLGAGLEQSTDTQLRGWENAVCDVGGESWGSQAPGHPWNGESRGPKDLREG